MRISAALTVVAGLIGMACGRDAREPEARVLSLLPLFEFAEVRAERFDLPFLLSRPLLEHSGWLRESGPGGEPILWMRGSTASLRIPLAAAADRELRLRARANPAIRRQLPVRLSWNGTHAGRLLLLADEQDFRLSLPAALQVAGENELRFEAAARPAARRTLALSSLRSGPEHESAGDALPERPEQGLRLPRGLAVSYHLTHAPALRLRMQVRGVGSEPARLLADVHDGDRSRRFLDVELRSDDTRSILEPLPSVPGRFFRLDLASLGGGVHFERLDLLSEPRPTRARAALPGRPNVVLFLVDALRADFLGAYGHPAPTSPRFDAFAREAVLFEDASAQSSWTRPSVASLLTGLGVEAHGVGGLTNLLVPEITTLAEALRAAGYRTGAFVANGVVSPALGFAQGFEAWNDGRAVNRRPSSDVVERALRWIDRGGEPFFLYVHTLDPHKPYEPSPEHWKPFLFGGYRGSRDIRVLLAKPQRTPDELRFLRSAYQGEIRQNDAAFGSFLDGLAARGLLERSLIGFTADHGEEFFDHGGYGHSGTLYGEVLHIPLALRVPGPARRPFRDPTPVQHADVAPTLLALVSARVPKEMEGRDLSARCLGRVEAPEEPLLLMSRLTYASADKVAARLGRLKLIVNQEAERAERPRFELYDLELDARETRNLAAERPLELRALHAQAAAQLTAGAALRARLKAGRETPVTAEQEEQLRALGYIQ